MIIIHNKEDKASREFVEKHGKAGGITVLNWYNEEDRKVWLNAGGTNQIRAFPSVLFVREGDYEEQDAEGNKSIIKSGWEVIDKPADLNTAIERKTYIEQKINSFKASN